MCRPQHMYSLVWKMGGGKTAKRGVITAWMSHVNRVDIGRLAKLLVSRLSIPGLQETHMKPLQLSESQGDGCGVLVLRLPEIRGVSPVFSWTHFILNCIIEQDLGLSNRSRFVDLLLSLSVGSVCRSCSCEGRKEGNIMEYSRLVLLTSILARRSA